MNSIRWGGVLALAILSVLVPAAGCSGGSGSAGSSDGGSLADGSSSNSGQDSPAGSDSGSGGGSSGSTPPLVSEDASIDSLCHGMTFPGRCMSCCQSFHTSGANTYYSALRRCVCGASGACQMVCATTYCATNQAMPAAGSDCGTCLNMSTASGGSCVAPVNAACQQDPDCVGFQNSCLPGCP